ncbi:MAG: hypothetical protein ACREDE_01740, partial [Thermoplasmata archaeon]
MGVALVLTLLLLSVFPGTVPSAAAPVPVAIESLSGSSPCPGSVLPHNYSGSVVVDTPAGGPPVSLRYSYKAVVTTNRTDGVVLSSVCSGENGTVAPNGNGTFALSIDPSPETNCTIPPNGSSGQCVTKAGPYKLVSVTPAAPVPPGYFAATAQAGTSFRVGIYPYLGSVVLAPHGPSATFSTGARDRVRATPLTGTGTPCPRVPLYDWTLAGLGWTFVAPPGGATVNVTAAPGSGIGNLTVLATLPLAGGELTAPPASVELLPVATTITSAGVNRTVLDVGQSARLAVNASGATGYRYSATLIPGLGVESEVAPCAATPESGGVSALSCAATWNYTSAGVAQPVVTVSNGVSSAVRQLPNVTVDPAPALTVSPSAPVGYVNASVPIVLDATSGTAPFREACLATGAVPVECSDAPGPVWSFAPVYSAAGRYSVLAWTVDATGTNRSVSATVEVVARLGVAIASNGSGASVGAALSVEVVVAGGDLPARLFWNASGSTLPSGSEGVPADGVLGFPLTPASAGILSLAVSVVDALGTAAGTSVSWVVGPGAATSVVPVVLPATTLVRAGAPLALAWQALNAAGEDDHDFAAVAQVELALNGSGRAAPGWVNASGLGPLAGPRPGTFDVPETAWIGGALNVSVTSEVAGAVDVDLVVASGPSGFGNVVQVIVRPDSDHLRLFDPGPSALGDRANDTLWRASDRFGNAVPGASVVVTSSFGAVSARTVVSVVLAAGGGSAVWVNYSAPNPSPGTVTVTDLAGDLLLPAIAVPGVIAPPPAALAEFTLSLGPVAGAALGTVAFLRRRGPRTVVWDGPEEDEVALQRLAEGRATVIEIVRRAGPLDLAGVAAAWAPPPAPPDLADWLASLLTDGSLAAAVGDDGVA